MPAPDPAQRRSSTSLILSFYLPAMLLAFSQGLLIPVLPLFAKSLQASYGLIGLVSAGTALGMLIGDVPGGVLVRKLGQRTAMLAGVGCTAVATITVFWARSIPEVTILRVITGFGTALYSVARHAYVADAVRTSGRGRAISLLGGLFRIGGFVGPLIGGTIAQAHGLRAPFLVVGATSAAAFVAVATFVRSTDNRHHSQSPPIGGHLAEVGVLHRVPDMDAIHRDMWAVSVDDAETRKTIADTWNTHRAMLEPHGAVGWAGLLRYREAGQLAADDLAVSLETAHPAKFPDELIAQTGVDPELPPSLAGLEALPETYGELGVDYPAFRDELLTLFG